MKKINAVVIATLLATVSLPALAQFSGLGGLGGAKASGGTGNVEGDIKGFVEKSAVVNKYAAQSLLYITAAYASDEERANAKARLEKLNATTDTKEQNALVADIQKTEGAKVAELAEAKDLGARTKALDKEKQKSIAAAVTNYLIAGARAADLTQSGQNIIQSASSNPMAVSKLGQVKDALPLLGAAVSSAGKVLPKFVDVLRGAKIDVPKVNADSKPVELGSI